MTVIWKTTHSKVKSGTIPVSLLFINIFSMPNRNHGNDNFTIVNLIDNLVIANPDTIGVLPF